MTTEPLTMEVVLPGMIDGDPFEVERVLLEDIYPAMDQFAEWIDAVCKQLANTERSRILAEHGSTMPADQLRHRYEETVRAGQVTRMQGAAKALVGAAAGLRA